jgi:hypothetical protein
MTKRALIIIILVCIVGFYLSADVFAQKGEDTKEDSTTPQLTLDHAVMCEEIFESAPRNQTVVFSLAKERAVCFTSFETVPVKTFIYHNWYYRDIPSARRRLLVRPPRWSTYSSIQIRKTDVGPWRVEITDSQGKILRVLRFSITE